MSFGLPYGSHNLDPVIQVKQTHDKLVRCFVRGCTQWLRPPNKQQRGDVCPNHGIRCHVSRGGGTYHYAEPERNIIASPQLFRQGILRNPLKYESHRLGLERSEDALTWSVLRSFQEAEQLHRIVSAITGQNIEVEPFLYLWGICCHDDAFNGWPLLMSAHRQFERHVPHDRPLTEPDIALHLPGRYLILIEAKFTSLNTWYERGRRKTKTSLTMEELLETYRDDSLPILNHTLAQEQSRIFQQLWRNMLFAAWMARADHPHTQPFHVNLVREGQDEASAAEFSKLIREPYQRHFQRWTWEQLYDIAAQSAAFTQLIPYMETKTAGLKPAFRIPNSQKHQP